MERAYNPGVLTASAVSLDRKPPVEATAASPSVPAAFRNAQLILQTSREGFSAMLVHTAQLAEKIYCGAAKSQLRLRWAFDTRRAVPGVLLMFRRLLPASDKPQTTFRVVMASFAAGVAAMVLAGLVAPTIVNGGLSLRPASAETRLDRAQLIEPLDVPAIRAQIAGVDGKIAAARQNTDEMVERLNRLAHD